MQTKIPLNTVCEVAFYFIHLLAEQKTNDND